MTTPSYDTRKYECCAPFHGEVGEEFTRRFRPEFEGALHSYVDAYASLYEHVVLQNDAGSPAAIAAGGGTGAAIMMAYNQRLKKSFGLIRRHVEDPTLRDDIDANAMGDGPAAWNIIVAACTMPQTYLNLANQDNEWTNTHISEVGFNPRTAENYRALLQRINRERPVASRKTDVQVWQKVLEGLAGAGNAELATLVRNEMQRPTIVHPAGHVNAGQPDLAAAVMYFGERWRSLLSSGAIKALPPKKRTPPMGNRVDAMMVDTSSSHLPPSPPNSPSYQFGDPYAFAVNPPEPERMCYNCRGFGHVKSEPSGKVVCPSPVRNRPIPQCIANLEAEMKRVASRFGRRKIFLRRNKQAAKMVTESNENSAEAYEIDEMQNVYDATGLCVGVLVDGQIEQQLPSQSNENVSTVAHTMTAAAISSPALPAEVPNVQLTATTVPIYSEGADQLDIDNDFENAFSRPAFAVAIADAELESVDDEDEGETPLITPCDRPMIRRTLHSARYVSFTLAAVLGVAALSTHGRSSKTFMLGSLAFLSAANAIAANPGRQTVVTVTSAMLSETRHQQQPHMLDARTAAALDTGASMHVSGRKELFPSHLISDYKPSIAVEVANDVKCSVEFKGSMHIPVMYRKGVGVVTQQKGILALRDALYVPALHQNTLISPRSMFHNEGVRCYFNDDRFCRTRAGHIVDMVETPSLYVIPFVGKSPSSKPVKVLAAPAKPISDEEMHNRCMHFSLNRIQRSSECLDNYTPSGSLPLKSMCKDCQLSAARKHPTPVVQTPRFTYFGECVCSDTCDMGEYSVPFGFRYFVTFLDMATKYLMVYFLRTHTHAEVKAVYVQYLADAASYLVKGRVNTWYMDNGSEFAVAWGVGKDKPGYHANDTDTWLAEYFTRRRFIVPWNPNQNPAESANRILLRPVRAALAHAGASTRYWPFPVHQGAIVHNALVTDSITAVHSKSVTWSAMVNVLGYPPIARSLSPFVMVHKRKFDVSRLHVLFCECHCVLRNPSDIAQRPKAAPRTTRAIHLGLDDRRAGYFVYLLEFARYTTSAFHDTYFLDESVFPPFPSEGGQSGEVRQRDAAARLPNADMLERERVIPESRPDPAAPDVPTDRADRAVPDRPSARTRSQLRDEHALVCHASMVPRGYEVVNGEGGCVLAIRTDVWRPLTCPTSVDEALAQDRERWMTAYLDDFNAKAKNGAFKFVSRTPGMKVHKLGWAHKLVWNDDNTLCEMRARLVGRGDRQTKGVDYVDSYSATPRAAAVRVFECAVCSLDLNEEHCDVVKAFTQNDVDDVELIVELPKPLLPVLDKFGKPMVVILLKALEGLRQSGFLHQRNHASTFKDNDVVKFIQCEYEPTLFVHVDNDIRIMALVWTDDVHFAYSKQASERYELFLSQVYGKRWNYKRKGPVSKFVGLNIRRDRMAKTIRLSATPFIEGIHRRFVPAGHPPRSMPYKSAETLKSIKPAVSPVEREAVKDKPYLSAVASCIWIYSVVRADIAFVLNVLCSVMHDPTIEAWNVLVDMISYLYSTRDIALTYCAVSDSWSIPRELSADQRSRALRNHGLVAYSDSSWSTPSYAGYVITLSGGPIEWATKTIKVICHSSAEAEVSAGSLCVKTLMYCRNVCNTVGLCLDGPTPLMLDSEAGIAIGTNQGVSPRTAHFLRWQHYMRWAKHHQYVELIFMSGKRQVADAITKPVDITLLRDFRVFLYGS